MPPRKPKGPIAVEATKHKDKRVNIPTEELREFVRGAEEAPKTLLYPRDPSLDPQLVWKGKDEQDRKPLEVPVVPIYIQEKIHPQALIENLRDTAKAGEPEPEVGLFDDFNGVKEFRQKIDFYSHDLGSQPKWANRMILGDSLLVMTSLAEKEGLKGKVQMIYVDPPYGIKFGSNWQVSTRKRDVRDGKLSDATRQPEQVRAFRDTWELGIHSYLAYLRDRLTVARDLLTETGSIFVQIGDENVHLVRCVMDEVFGSENFLSLINFTKAQGKDSGTLATVSDYLVWYARTLSSVKYRQVYDMKVAGRPGATGYVLVEDPTGSLQRSMTNEESQEGISGDWRIFDGQPIISQDPSTGADFPFEFRGRSYTPPENRHWSTGSEPSKLARVARANRLYAVGNRLEWKRYLDEAATTQLTNTWIGLGERGFTGGGRIYVVQTAAKVIERCLLMTTDPGDLVLDPTCGSGTTAFVAEQWGRRWMTVDTSRVALALARTRLISAKYPYFLLMDSAEGRQKEAEITGSIAALTTTAKAEDDIKKGFVYKRVPYISLKSIADNEEIDAIHSRYEEVLLSLYEKLNKLLKRNWNEWEVPRDADSTWPAPAAELTSELWRLRRERKKEIDESISRHADTELLFDQPYQDDKRVRVTGPFTVESLSPHRVLSTDEARRPAEPASGSDASTAGSAQFETMILDNLRKAGVQNTRRNERLVWQRLEPFAGAWLQAAGEYADTAGRPRRVAISIGPEHGTVGQRQIQEAAKEALKGVSFDLLLVLGFAFDAHATEVAKEISPRNLKVEEGFVAEWEEEYGRLPVLLVKMNPDLSMGDELLKKTGAGNLFMVFGEPDMEIRRENGRVVVEIKGLDVYDPTTGVILSSSTDDIACWFLDTNYDDESFFVRHAYFTGAGDPYERLKRALRAEIDEAAWASLYSTVSRPFESPSTGKIAIKVINHYGDEVLKVFTDFPSKAGQE